MAKTFNYHEKKLDHPVPIKRADLAPRVRFRRWAIIYAVNEWERSDRNIEFVNPSEFEFEDVRICHETHDSRPNTEDFCLFV